MLAIFNPKKVGALMLERIDAILASHAMTAIGGLFFVAALIMSSDAFSHTMMSAWRTVLVYQGVL